MSDLHLTEDERLYVAAALGSSSGTGARLGFYASFLVPALLFAGYGISTGSILAVTFALIGLLIFLGWRISREIHFSAVSKSLFQKILQHERDSGSRI